MKKLLSILVVALLSVTMFAAGGDNKTLYLNTGGSSLWNQASARFAAWYWSDDLAGAFTEVMTLADGETDIYTTSVPNKAKKIIFVRLNSTASSDNQEAWWSEGTKWNQTANLDIPVDGGNMYTITGWGDSDGKWSQYGAPAPEKVYGLVGDFCGWDEKVAVPFTKINDTLTVVIDSLFGAYKVVVDNSWAENYGAWGENPYELLPGHSAYGMQKGNESKNFTLTDSYKDATFQIYTEDEQLKIRFVSGQKVEAPAACVPSFGLLVNGTDYVAGIENQEAGQWEIENVILKAGDILQAYDTCSGAAWVPAYIDHMEYFDAKGALTEGGKYSFYLKLGESDQLYIVKKAIEYFDWYMPSDKTATDLNALVTTDLNTTGGVIYFGAAKFEEQADIVENSSTISACVGYKLDGNPSESSTKYVLCKLDKALALNDVITVYGFCTSNPKEGEGFQVSADRAGSQVIGTALTTKKKEVEAFTFTVTDDAFVGATQIYITRISVSVHFRGVNIAASGSSTGLNEIEPATMTSKMFVNGQLIIIRDGVRYNAMGQVVE